MYLHHWDESFQTSAPLLTTVPLKQNNQCHLPVPEPEKMASLEVNQLKVITDNFFHC